ncbi:SRPBCC family protein [Bacillus sp. DX1.1]|uniref:SRPBCC family protein n=1 Tax=unclassified Bacillus (in: firmicutes) TaxID=185979 RepID=UPI0025708DFB|nr:MULTISPECIES: SRPBCC family protein [unclassified Bacillus (in: firmicutes)]MDM5155047.1 SRPBCC family protein [Bacillus sp. DX1.1]WJE83907.1 SRPBCC family protein [Bacillus sp. DX3.1]
MLAIIEKMENGYVAQYNRPLSNSVEKVWAALTENDKLARWMPNLQVEDLRKGGTIKFDMMDGSGTFIDIEILDCRLNSVLEFTWGNDRVRFELYRESDGCLLTLKEFINAINDHTPKDLAGWHICLDVLSALLDGCYMEFPKEEWERWYKKYDLAIKQMKSD